MPNINDNDIANLLSIVQKISIYNYQSEASVYARVMGPNTFIHKGSNTEYSFWHVDLEPGDSWFKNRWEAFLSFGAKKFSNFWLNVEGDSWLQAVGRHKTKPITLDEVPVMLFMVKSAEEFYHNGNFISGPWTRLSGKTKEFYSVKIAGTEKPRRTYSLSAAFKLIGLNEEAKTLKKLSV